MAEQQTSPLTIVGYEDNCNLRELSWNETVLEKVKRDHNLAHGEAVIFANEARTRFRLVASVFGMPMLILPPIDPEDKTSLYLKEARFLRRFRMHSKEVLECIDAEIEKAETRIKNRKKQAAKALQKRG